MSEKFFNVIMNMLKGRQVSISGIARELKVEGYEVHRLIITGYLRALFDTGYLEEIDIPPSKVYTYNQKKQEKDIYRILEDRLREVDSEYRYPVAVFVLTSLFNRPCFKHELGLLGIAPKSTPYVKESTSEHINEYREGISRIEIPPADKAYEMKNKDPDIISKAAPVIFSILKDTVDLSGLRSKYHATKISQFVEAE